MTVTRNLRIRGHVQGVGFRMYVVRKARQLGLSGWVRNRLDGSVEADVQGPAAAVDALIAAARRGPPGSMVNGVQVSDSSGEYQGFETRPTE
ncbi:MAG TPA: acylphosphatase [Vitreimonas sp.]|nr:acylphosphatase [Vitreimonas sp.]